MRPYIIAHRGGSLGTPENTLPAFLAAKAMGADGVETDVQLTRDGKLVLHHNYTIDANSNGSGAIHDMSYDELLRYDFGSYAGECWRGTPIPTLSAFLEAVGDMRFVNVELKAPVDRTIPYVESVLEEIGRSRGAENVVISAFDHSLLRRVKELQPEMPVAALTMPTGFADTALYAMLEKYFPADRVLFTATAEDLGGVDPAAFSPREAGLPGADAREAVAELAHQLGAVYPQSCLSEVKLAMQKQADLPAYLQSLDFKPDFLHCHFKDVLKNPGLIAEMDRLGIAVNVWTPDQPEHLCALLRSGCHGIITNRPDLLKEMEGR